MRGSSPPLPQDTPPPPPRLPLLRGCLVTAKISPFSAQQCSIKKYRDGALVEVDGFTPQLAKGSTQQASTPGTGPCPLLGDLRDCVQPGSPGSASLPPSSRMQRALRGDLLQEGTGRAQTWCRMESTQDQGLLVTDTQVRNTSSKTRSD